MMFWPTMNHDLESLLDLHGEDQPILVLEVEQLCMVKGS